MRWFSIKIKYSLFLALLLMLTVLVLSLFALQGIRDNQLAVAEQNLLIQTRTANITVKQAYYEASSPEPQAFLRRRGQQLAMDLAVMSGLRVQLYDSAGRKTGDSLPLGEPVDEPEALSFALEGKIAHTASGDFLLYAAPLQGPGKQMGIIVFQYPLTGDLRFYHQISDLFFIAGTAVTAISFLLGYLYFGRSASAIIRLNRAAERIREGDFPSTPPLRRRNDELGRLSEGIYYMSEEILSNLNAMQAEDQKLRQAIVKLQELERQQREFIGNISHEFKTPLTSIKAYVELMSMYPDDAALQADANRRIGQESARLQEMVETVLRLAALEKYDFEYEPVDVELHELLNDLAERMEARAIRNGQTLHTELEPAVIRADRESLTHIFVNLLDNAIKYNVSGGEIRVTCRLRNGQVTVDVSDTGIGVPEEEREKIFEPFHTANKHRSRQAGGAGLGLALVKRLTEKQNGNVELLREPKKTVFRVIFPAQGLGEYRGG